MGDQLRGYLINTVDIAGIVTVVTGAVIGLIVGLVMKYNAERSPHIASAYITLAILIVSIPIMRLALGFTLTSILIVSLFTLVGAGLLYIELRIGRSVFLRTAPGRSRRRQYWAKHISKLKAKGINIRELQCEGRLPSTRELSNFGLEDFELRELGLRE